MRTKPNVVRTTFPKRRARIIVMVARNLQDSEHLVEMLIEVLRDLMGLGISDGYVAV